MNKMKLFSLKKTLTARALCTNKHLKHTQKNQMFTSRKQEKKTFNQNIEVPTKIKNILYGFSRNRVSTIFGWFGSAWCNAKRV